MSLDRIVTASSHRRVFAAINLIGGIAVLASYGYGLSAHPETRSLVWGGVPDWMRPFYVASMVAATIGYFPLTSYLWLAVDPERVHVAGRYGYGAVSIAYAVILVGSASWMPLTFRMIDEPQRLLWLTICLVLAAVGLAAVAVLALVTSIEPTERGWWHRFACLGALAFCAQTLVLDATIWPAYYPY